MPLITCYAKMKFIFSTYGLFLLSRDTYKVNNLSDIMVCNYADDTAIGCTDGDYDTARNKLLNASEIMLD